MPAQPEPLVPADESLIVFSTAPPRVRFEWAPDEHAESYGIVLARDLDLRDVAYGGVVSEPAFSHGNLKPGIYFWQVTGRSGRVEGPPGPVRSFAIQRDSEPPVLHVSFPEHAVHSASLRIAGETEPGAEVFVGGSAVETHEDGSFAHELSLEPGVNVVVVSAIDPAGNRTYQSGLVRFSPGSPENES